MNKKQKHIITRFILKAEAFEKSSFAHGCVALGLPELDAVLSHYDCTFLHPIISLHWQHLIDEENSPLKRGYIATFMCGREKHGRLLDALVSSPLIEGFLLEPRDYTNRAMRKLMRVTLREIGLD